MRLRRRPNAEIAEIAEIAGIATIRPNSVVTSAL